MSSAQIASFRRAVARLRGQDNQEQQQPPPPASSSSMPPAPPATTLELQDASEHSRSHGGSQDGPPGRSVPQAPSPSMPGHAGTQLQATPASTRGNAASLDTAVVDFLTGCELLHHAGRIAEAGVETLDQLLDDVVLNDEDLRIDVGMSDAEVETFRAAVSRHASKVPDRPASESVGGRAAGSRALAEQGTLGDHATGGSEEEQARQDRRQERQQRQGSLRVIRKAAAATTGRLEPDCWRSMRARPCDALAP